MKLEIAPSCAAFYLKQPHGHDVEKRLYSSLGSCLSAHDKNLPIGENIAMENDCQPKKQNVKLYLRRGSFGFGNRRQIFLSF